MAPGQVRRAGTTPVALALGLTLGVSLISACGSSYDPPSLINKLRVLAVRAEPPFLRPTGNTILTPLVVGLDEPLCYAWAFCPFAWPKDGQYRCFDPRLLQPVGAGASATVTPAHMLATLAKVPEVFADLGVALPKGLDPKRDPAEAQDVELQVLFKVATLQSVGGKCPSDIATWIEAPCVDREACVAGVKRLALVTTAEAAHTNPKLEGLRLDGVLWPDDLTPTVVPYRGDPDDTFLGLKEGAIRLLPVWSEDSLEPIGARLDPGASGVRNESLLFSWFSTAGDYQKQRSFDDFPDNALLPPERAGPIRIWLVARDGRNGVDWLSREVDVQVKGSAGHPLCARKPALDGCPSP